MIRPKGLKYQIGGTKGEMTRILYYKYYICTHHHNQGVGEGEVNCKVMRSWYIIYFTK